MERVDEAQAMCNMTHRTAHQDLQAAGLVLGRDKPSVGTCVLL